MSGGFTIHTVPFIWVTFSRSYHPLVHGIWSISLELSLEYTHCGGMKNIFLNVKKAQLVVCRSTMGGVAGQFWPPESKYLLLQVPPKSKFSEIRQETMGHRVKHLPWEFFFWPLRTQIKHSSDSCPSWICPSLSLIFHYVFAYIYWKSSDSTHHRVI